MNTIDDQNTINALGDSFTAVKGLIDNEDARNYILGLLILKKLSDLDGYEVVDWKYISSIYYNIGDQLNKSFNHIEKIYPEFSGWFEGLDYDSNLIGDRQIRDMLWKNIILLISSIDFRCIEKNNLLDISELCIQFNDLYIAKSSKRGSLETPSTIVRLMAALIEINIGDTVYDPFCGSGITLIKASDVVINNTGRNAKLFGQTSSQQLALTARLNMILTDHRNAQIAIGDAIRQPSFTDGKRLMKFHNILCTIPSGKTHWGEEVARYDPYQRFIYGLPPAAAADLGYLQHCIASLNDDGLLIAAVSSGFLFRGRTEGDIRRRMIEDDIFEAVILLPPKLYSQTNIPIVLLVMRRNKPAERKGKILFINAKDYLPGRMQNTLSNEDIDKIINIYKNFNEEDGISSIKTLEDIADKNFSLNVSEYVVEELTWMVDLDLEATLKELDRIHNAKIVLYEGMNSNLKKIVDSSGGN